MNLKAGNMYFVSDAFFERVNDPFLKINYKQTKRPHYFAFQDMNTGLYWLVPCSSKVEKFEKIIRSKQAQHKPTDIIKIVTIQDRKSALLFQDMFPVTTNYIQEPYIRGGQPVSIHDPKVVKALEKTAKKVVSMLRRGIRFTPTQPDVIHIEQLMLSDIQQDKNMSSEIAVPHKEQISSKSIVDRISDAQIIAMQRDCFEEKQLHSTEEKEI